MTAQLWVPLTQRLATRNWKRASSGWERTAAMVANRVAVSTPLIWASVVVVMVDPFLGWESGRGGEQLRVAERVGHTVPGDRVAVVAGVADQRPSRAVAAAHVIGHPGDAADRRGEASVARPLADAGREPDEIGDERVAALGSGPADALQERRGSAQPDTGLPVVGRKHPG